ncbi:MAG: TRAP transporter substrate-binding protein [Firmicutes bacterium]|nr:TRAP transporter substrate-binding protein [Bacillota bacterium]
MKKIVSLIVSAMMSLSLAACGSTKSLATDSSKYPWVLCTSSPADTVTGIYAQAFADQVHDLSDGKMNIVIYDNSTLGGDRELLESCYSGDVKFIVQNTAPQVSFMPELAIFDLPMAYDTIEQVREALDDEEFQGILNDIYTSKGYRLLGMADQSFRTMTTNKEITNIDGFKGQKIRTMENSYHLAFWKAIGANPAPMAFSEVYIGLQQGTIDAQENPVEVIVSSRLYEQQKYVVETNHLPHLLSLITNDQFYNDLPEDQRKIIDQASENAKAIAREQSDERISGRIAIVEENGTQIVQLDEQTKQAIRDKSSSLYEEIRKNVGDTLYNAYLKHATWMNK